MDVVAKDIAPAEPAAVFTAFGPTLTKAIGYLLGAAGFLIGARLIADNSFFTHLATGRIILDTGAVPTVDPYSATAAGEPWTVQSWFASALYAGLEQTAGLWSLRVLNGLLCLATVAAIWRLTDEVQNMIVRFAIAAAPIAVGSVLWSPRPLLFGLLGLALVLEVAAGRRPTWQVLPIMWVWVNTHGSFPLAGIAAGTLLVGRWLETRSTPSFELKVFGWVSLGTLLGAINPLGLKVLTFPIELLGRREALEGVNEWGPPAIWSIEFVAFALLLGTAILVGLRTKSLVVLVPAIVFGASGLLAMRNLATASLVLVAVAAPALKNVKPGLNATQGGLLARAMTVIAVCLVGLTVALSVAQGALDLDSYPVAQVDWLEERQLVANPDVALAQGDDAGNYLELRFGADANVFMDDRFDFYPLDLVKDHLALAQDPDGIEVLDERSIDVVLWERASVLEAAMLDDGRWQIVQSDDDWFVACRIASAVC